MRSAFNDRRVTTGFTLGVYQFGGVNKFPTFITLVTSGILITTQWTRAFHKPISQEPVGRNCITF